MSRITCEELNLTNNKATMGIRTLAVLLTIAFSVIGVLGDYFLKLASARNQPLQTISFYLGFVLYPSPACGWFFVIKHIKLAIISFFSSAPRVLPLPGMGFFVSREPL